MLCTWVVKSILWRHFAHTLRPIGTVHQCGSILLVWLLYGLCYCPRQFLFRIGRVTKFLIKVAQMFLIKVAQMYGVFLGYCWKESLSKSKLLGLLWSNFCPLFISTSGHTEEMKETEWSQHWNTLNDYSVYILGRCHLVFQVFCTR